MISIQIDASDLESKIAQLDIGALRTAVGVAVAEAARDVLTSYPPPSRKPQPPRSPMQRRKVMAMVRAGLIPYRRTGQLGNRWITQPNGDGAALTNTTPYAALVQSAQEQAAYHKGVWPTDQDAAEKLEQAGTAADVATKVVVNALDKAGLS